MADIWLNLCSQCADPPQSSLLRPGYPDKPWYPVILNIFNTTGFYWYIFIIYVFRRLWGLQYIGSRFRPNSDPGLYWMNISDNFESPFFCFHNVVIRRPGSGSGPNFTGSESGLVFLDLDMKSGYAILVLK